MPKEEAGQGPAVAHRTLRKLALEKGTNAAAFPEVPATDPESGTPVKDKGGDFRENAPAGSTTSNSPAAQPQGVPFRLKG